MRAPPEVLTSVPLPISIFMALCEHKSKTGTSQLVEEMAAEAVRDWLAAQEQRVRRAHAPAAMAGYQWKDVFLPHGTVLRAVMEGRSVHATVEGDTIVFNGQAVSPSRFVNTDGRTVRNAWTVVWLLFPQQSTWRRADDCRVNRWGRQRPLKIRSDPSPAPV